MKVIVRMAVAAAAVAAAGCSSLPGANLGDTFVAESWINSEIEGGSYTQELAKAYQERAAWEAGTDTNWLDATAFMRKGRAAQAGEEVQPWDPASLGVSGDVVAAYQQTLAASAQNKDANPKACAQMVALYDHWIEQIREGSHSVTNPGAVQGAWAAARYECTGGADALARSVSPRFVVYFGFNSARLDAAAIEVVDAAVAEVESLGGSVPISIAGYTDTVGSDEYNQALSERRARAVADAMVSRGVAADDMSLAGFSEGDLAVATGDGVREPLNRRVVVTVD